MFRRPLLAALLLSLALIASACGQSAPTAPAGSSSGESAPAAPAATAAPAELSGTVTFWTTYNTVSPEFVTLQEQVIPAFNTLYPNVTVDAQALPYDETRRKLLASIAGGEAPDLVRADIAWSPELAALGALTPLDQAMPDFESYKARVFEGPLATNFYQGSYYGLPLNTNTRVLFSNSALLEEAGVTAAPTSFEELMAACEQVKALGKPDTYCFADGGTYAWAITPWIWSAGGAITDGEYTTASGFMNGEGTVRAATMLRDMLGDGALAPNILGGSDFSSNDAFAKGQVAFILDGPWATGVFKEQYPDLQYDMATFPAGPGGSVSVLGGENIIMMESSQNKEAALAFMRFMLGEESQVMMAKTGQMPVLKSLTGSPEMPEYFAVFQEQLATAQPRTPHPAWPKVEEALSNAFLSVLLGEQEPQAALDQAAATADALLAEK